MLDRQLVVVRNPFDRTQREAFAIREGATVGALVGEYIPAGVDVYVSINGHLLKREAWAGYALVPRDQMVIVPCVQGGGDNLLGTVLMVALAVAAPGIGAAAAGAMGLGTATLGLGLSAAAWGSIIAAGVGLVGSMVIGSLMAPAKPSLPGASSYDTSPAYAWSPVTTQQPGAPIARAYGLFKLYGNIIAGYIENTGDTGSEQTAHILIDLGQGPYTELYDHKINDQPISLYSGVKVTERLGLLTQAIIPSFNDTRANSTFAAGKIVNGTPVTRSTTGTQFSALEVVLTCPGGLWYANDSGGLDVHAVNIKLEISTDSGVTWKIAAQSAATTTTASVSTGYWSAGYWTEIGGGDGGPLERIWKEMLAGSSTRADHTEGEQYMVFANTTYMGYWRWIETAAAVTAAATTNDYLQLSGASQKAIRKTVRIDGLTIGTACQIRATNLSTDYSANSRYGDAVYLAEVNEVILDDFTYPRTVLVGIDALATNQLSGAIKFSCLAKGAKVWVGGSSGTFAWSQNPAWVAYDILTQPVTNDAGTAVLRYDGFNPSRIDLQSFTDWAAFCNVAVADGKGGTEPRCQFDGVFDTVTDMWTAALDVAATARATLITRGTTIAAVYDDTRATPVQVFTVANSRDFSEDFLKMEGRAAVIEVDFANRDLDYGRDIVPIINDAVAAASPGSPPASVALRITRASQAWREANYRLAKNQYLQRFAELSVDIDSLAATVGDRVDIQNDVPEWGEGGRAVTGSTTSITLDHPVTLAAATTYEITVRLSGTTDAIEKRTISTGAGTYSTVAVSSAFSAAVSQYDVWAIGIANASTKPFIVTAIARDSAQRAKLSLIEYNPSIYGLDGGIPAIPTPNVSASTGFGNITGVTASEQLSVAADGTAQTVVTLHWGFSNRSKVRATHVIAQPTGTFKYGQTAKQAGSVTDSAQFVGLEDGASYTFTLVSENYLGQTQPLSAGATLTYAVVGRTATAFATGKAGPPATPTALTATGGLFAISLAWTVDVGGRKDVAYTEVWAATTNNRASASRITCAPWPDAAYKHIGLTPGQSWYYWTRLADSSGNLSGWFPSGATSGVSGSPSTDPSAMLTQLTNSVGMSQLASELAAPIAFMPGSDSANAIATLQIALSDYDLTNRMLFQENVTNATITTDPLTGKISLLATASVTTDVEARLTAVEIVENADHATLTATVGTVSSLGSELTTAQGQISVLQSDVLLKASETYVDNAVATSTGGLTVTAANSALLLSEAAIQEALDAFTQGTSLNSITSNVATVQDEISAHATAIEALTTARTALVSVVAGNIAAIGSEAMTRATDVSAVANRTTVLETAINSGTTGLATRAAASDVTALQTLTGDATHGNTALASRTSSLESSVNNATTGLATRAAASDVTALQTLTGDATHGNLALASTASTISARLDTGDYAAVKTQSSANASTLSGVVAKYAVKVDANGHVTGFELISDGTTSNFVIISDNFQICKSGATPGTPVPVFTLGTVNGASAVGVAGNLIVDGSIITRTIAAENITVPRSAFTQGTVSLTSGAWTAVQSLSITTSGAPVYLIASAVVDATANNTLTSTYLQIDRDGISSVTVALSGWGGPTYYATLAGSLIDTPAAGAHTYTVYVLHNSVGATAINRSLFALEMRR